jgi:3'-phosphoadenosine 5'-phosphosulfate sulfotransferase (PAPS reductase)/FAD synthetase
MREVALLHAKLKQHRIVVNRSRHIIETALEKLGGWYVALSGGKDSTAVLNLVREQAPDTPAVCSLPEFHLPETADYLSRVGNLDVVASGSDHGTDWSPNWESPDDLPDTIRWLGERGHVAKNYGRDEGGVFLGLRQDESGTRKIHLRTSGVLFFNQSNQVWQCNPISHWSVLDVWGYLLSNDLDYNRAYDVMDRAGIPLEKQRIGPLAVEKALGYGQLAILKRCWPELFNEYAARHPEARSYV